MALRKRQAIVGECQAGPGLVFKHPCLCDKIGVVSHEQLAAPDDGESLKERKAQGQQWLQGGEERSDRNRVIIRSHIWAREAWVFNIYFKAALEELFIYLF